MAAYKERIGVIGATSIVGECLLPLLVQEGWNVVAFSRQALYVERSKKNCSVTWQLLSQVKLLDHVEKPIPLWVSLAPITALPEYFPMLLTYGAKHVVAVSSTSIFTKNNSSDPAEKELAQNLADGEKCLNEWANKKGLSFTILRTTMVYGLGRDKNISVMAAFIKRFSFFCLFGSARGLRQPLHAQDVALVCIKALSSNAAINRYYNLSGGEIITYREMLCRIFSALGKLPRFIKIPLWLFRLAIFVLQMFKPFRAWSAAMAERMNEDMVFDHAEAKRDLNFSPRNFRLTEKDLP